MSSTTAAAPVGDPAAGFLSSTVGKKMVMAATGVVLFGFVLAHMAGNLQVYMGPEALNAYGKFLHEFLHGGGLWVARIVLLGAVALHVWAATSLTLTNRAARPIGYRQLQSRESTYASRTMRASGFILLAFILFHLAHFTTGHAHPRFVPGDVYGNFVLGFQSPIVCGLYLVANLLLGMHLRHGVWSMLQTLGLNHPRYNALRETAATVFATVVTLGNISFPIAVLAGVIR